MATKMNNNFMLKRVVILCREKMIYSTVYEGNIIRELQCCAVCGAYGDVSFRHVSRYDGVN